MYIVSGYSADRYDSSLFEPVAFNTVEAAVKQAVEWFIPFAVSDYDYDDDDVVEVDREFEPEGTFEEGNLPLDSDGCITVKALREALIEQGRHSYYAITSGGCDYFIEIAINKVDDPED